MKLMYVYLLRCADQSFYTGVTNNLDKRIIEHNKGYNPNCYTFSRRPVTLVFREICSSPREAIAFEKKIKGWSHSKKEALIRGDWHLIHELAKCRNETSSDNYSGK